VTWTFLKDTRDEMALKRFIQEFPKSPLRAQADERIAALASEAERAKALEAERAKALEIERAKALEAERTKTAAISQFDPREVTRSLQLELKRVGCFDGTINGEFSNSTRAALRNFAKLASVSLPENEPSLDALKAVRGFDKRICPLVCPAGERAEGERCVRIACPSGQVLKDGACIARPAADAQKRATTPPEPPPAATGSKCFTFQGRRFCE
jgi:peptidoglycan hydrolase-like protein with peptidoglycan-binding domain